MGRFADGLRRGLALREVLGIAMSIAARISGARNAFLRAGVWMGVIGLGIRLLSALRFRKD